MAFDYSYTCSDIDREISKAKSHIEENILDIVKECSPLLQDEPLNDFVKDCSNHLYQCLEDCFEITRNTNSDMRKDAENRIESLEDIISELQTDLDIARTELNSIK